jgi:prepilin-type N-terminal cleavage/methylation domain-containing protein
MANNNRFFNSSHGFTLIEISIVLVIIGLIVGGILVGRDLINAAAIRAQISQLEKYNTAVNTFKLKYGYLPGDIKDPDATALGFSARGTYAGQGDGNGLLEGFTANAVNSNLGVSQTGENMMFWVDLSQANLIDGKLNTMTSTALQSFTAQINPYLPTAKIGNNNFIYVYSNRGIQYYGLANIMFFNSPSDIATNVGLTVMQSYAIDNKLDDGLPMSGNINVQTVGTASGGPNFYAMWIPGRSMGHSACGYINNKLAPCTSATPGDNNTCYDNNNTVGATQKYSLNQNGGNGINCGLSFKMQ